MEESFPFDPRVNRPYRGFDPFNTDLATPDPANSEDMSLGPDGSWDSEAFLRAMSDGGRRPMPKMINAEECRRDALMMSREVLSQHGMLQEILQRHEATIQKRWIKKSNQQRKTILLGAWPNMAAKHRPDIEIFRRTRGPMQVVEGQKRNAFMWPYINLEDLTKGKLFLLMLNSRGRNQPYHFAQADFEACHFGTTTQALVPPFLNGYVMMFNGRSTPESYGQLLAWGDHPDAFQWMISKRGVIPGQGLFVLEIQSRLYKFLVESCKAILHDMTDAQLVDPSISVQPEPPSVSGNETSGLPAIEVAIKERPYRLPANLDLHRLKVIIAGKASATEDHVWALREDPGYFANVLYEWRQHRQELLLDTKGAKHPLLDPGRVSVFWGYIVHNAINSALYAIEVWRLLETSINDIIALKQKYDHQIVPENDLPAEYAMAIYKILRYLEDCRKIPINLLRTGFTASPPLRSAFCREPPTDILDTKMVIRKRTSLQQNEDRDYLVWLIFELFDADQVMLFGLDNLVGEIDKQMRANPDMVSSWIADQFADLAVFSLIEYELRHYQPWGATFFNDMVGKDDELNAAWVEAQKPLAAIYACQFKGRISKLGDPSDSRFRYPVEKMRTKENVQAMRTAEGNLDAFWVEVDKELVNRKAMTPALNKLFTSRKLERTAEWIEAAAVPAKPTKDDIICDFAHLDLDRQWKTEKTLEPNVSQSKEAKEKTRGSARPEPLAPEPAPSAQEDQQPQFKVDRRALKAFKTIFFTPSSSSQPGEVPWADFLHAMVSTGFTAEKLYGSVWQFTPTNLDVEIPIQIHEPHPSGKIPYMIARKHGRRLTRNYGWHAGMFSLR